MADPNLEGFIIHARRFGTECVYETAQRYLRPHELGKLALELKTLKRRLTPVERHDLAERLFDDGERMEEVARFTGLRKSALYAIRQKVSDAHKIAA